MRVSGNRSTRSWQDLCYNFTNRVSDCSVYTGRGKHTQIYKTALYVILVCAFTSLDNSSYTTLTSFIAAPLEIAQSGRVLSILLQSQVFFQVSSSLFWPLKIMGLGIRLFSHHVDGCRLIEWHVISVTPCAGSLVLIAVSYCFWSCVDTFVYVSGLSSRACVVAPVPPQCAAPVPQCLPCLRVFSQCVFPSPVASSPYPLLSTSRSSLWASSPCGHFSPLICRYYKLLSGSTPVSSLHFWVIRMLVTIVNWPKNNYSESGVSNIASYHRLKCGGGVHS